MKSSVRDSLIVLVLGCAAFLAHNTVLCPDIMECRNIVAAREMVTDGHWLVPTLNGELRLEKPPLPTWLTALTWFIAPDSLALERGMAALAGLLLLWGMYATVALLRGRRAALFSTVVLLTCYNVVLMGRTASWDIYCHAFVMTALPPLIHALRGEHPWRHWLLCGLLLGLSFMSKGPISLYALLLPFVIALCMAERRGLSIHWPALAGAVLVCAVVGGWWYVCVRLTVRDAMDAVVARETGNWTTYNTRPWWYYWRFFAESGLWAPLALWTLVAPVVQRLRRCPLHWGLLLPWLWTLLSVVLLSLFPEKKMRYLLPVMMPLSMLIGTWLGAVRGRWAGRLLAVVAGLFFVVEVALLPFVNHLFGYPQRHSLAATRSDERLAGIPFLHDAAEQPRPEILWAAGQHILLTDLSSTDSICAHLPCAVLTHEPPAQTLPADLWQRVDSVGIGQYDDNYTRRHRSTFVYHITLLRPKQP